VEALAAGAHILAATISMVEARTALLQALNAAETANRTRAQFLAAMSHELRTPLNAVIGFSEMMVQQVLGPIGNDSYGSYARHIHDSGTYLLRLIDNVLDKAKIDSGRWELEIAPVALSQVVEEALDLVQIQATRARITLETEFDPEVPAIQADAGAVKRMVLNLLSNALKYTPPEGRVVVSARRLPGALVELAVADSGVGIPSGEFATVFQPFHRVTLSGVAGGGGTGLGLAIVKSLIELHGGHVRLASEVGRGTTVALRFPNAPPP
jgi:signal transduction histidine kinase